MGSKSSKVAKSASQSLPRRQYPQRVPPVPPTPTPTTPGRTANATAKKPSDLLSDEASQLQSPPQSTSAPSPSLASTTKDASIMSDAADPDFAASLRSIGPVQHPGATYSHSSTVFPSSSSSPDTRSPDQSKSGAPAYPDPSQNVALRVLSARERITREAEAEFVVARTSGWNEDVPGRKYVDVARLREALRLRDGKGMADAEIEKKTGLKKGTVGTLGCFGVPGFERARQEAARARVGSKG